MLPSTELAARRAQAQLLGTSRASSPGEVARRMLAMQGQDYAGVLWAVGVRGGATTRSEVEQALDAGVLVRSWPLRGTLHLCRADDLRLLLAVSGPRALAGARGRLAGLGLTPAVQERAAETARESLAGGGALTRAELLGAFADVGLDVSGQRGVHLLFVLSVTGLVCLGPTGGRRSQSFVLLDEWAPGSGPERGEALATVARRYAAGHGPVGAADLAWWAGIPLTEARAALDAVGLSPVETEQGTLWAVADEPAEPGPLRLLPSFDELLLGYRDRTASLDPAFAGRVAPGANGLFRPIVAEAGRVTGVWSRARTAIDVDPFDASRPIPETELEEQVAARLRFD